MDILLFDIKIKQGSNKYNRRIKVEMSELREKKMNTSQGGEKQMTISRFSPILMKQSTSDVNNTMGSNSYSDDESMFDTDQQCLLRLMQQRKRIQQLTYLHQKATQQLRKQQQKVKKYQMQQPVLQELKTMKGKYLSLVKEFQSLVGEKHLIEEENGKLRESLTEFTKQHNKLVKLSQLREQRMDEEHTQSTNRYQELLKDKEDQIRRTIDIDQLKEKQFNQHMQQLAANVTELKEEMKEMKRRQEQEAAQLTAEIVKRDGAMEKMKKIIDNVKEENAQLRKQIKQVDTQFVKKQKEWLVAQDEFVYEINQQKRKVTDLQSIVTNIQYQKQKLEQKLTAEKASTQLLKQQLRQLEENSSIAQDQLTHSYEQKVQSLSHQIDQLRDSVEELLQVKEILLKQNQSQKDQIERDQESKRRRNMVMRSEMREIQKISNSVKKVFL